MKGKKGGDKVDLTIKNVIFRNSTLVTYTYIYINEINKYLHWILNVCFTWIMWVKKITI